MVIVPRTTALILFLPPGDFELGGAELELPFGSAYCRAAAR